MVRTLSVVSHTCNPSHIALYVQSFAQNPAASPLAQRNNSRLLSTTHIESALVLPLSQRKYAALSPIIPLPKITVRGSLGVDVIPLPRPLAEGTLSDDIVVEVILAGRRLNSQLSKLENVQTRTVALHSASL